MNFISSDFIVKISYFVVSIFSFSIEQFYSDISVYHIDHRLITRSLSLSFLEPVEPHLDLFPQVLQVDQFLQGTELVSLDLVESQEALGSPSWQFDRLYFLSTQTILDPILLDLTFAFLFGRVVAGIYDEVVFSGDPCLLHVVLEHLF